MTDEVKDTWTTDGDKLVRARSYPLRDKILKQNLELQKQDAVKPTDGLRAFANFPPMEKERLAAKYPKYADLVNPDPKIASAATVKLVNSPEGKCYRVGGTNRKSFRFKVNPLAKDR